ncbi:hypothetical protein HMPREF9442_03200 [Paraprevotella xylaniphila YIT 11841]|uniref:Uncharacterized protein n=1 Tax=Paraprevotella xylaniphila YIT 11841 TaxID=762982 RepID=F3QYA7_9BACT|nr:hypothetical protein HMPREF9442_03200 [Paraprevotella xylaniphila YIT 11841]
MVECIKKFSLDSIINLRQTKNQSKETDFSFGAERFYHFLTSRFVVDFQVFGLWVWVNWRTSWSVMYGF